MGGREIWATRNGDGFLRLALDKRRAVEQVAMKGKGWDAVRLAVVEVITPEAPDAN